MTNGLDQHITVEESSIIQRIEGHDAILSFLDSCQVGTELKADSHSIKAFHFVLKGRFLLFQEYRYFAFFSKLSVSTFYKEISKYHRKGQLK